MPYVADRQTSIPLSEFLEYDRSATRKWYLAFTGTSEQSVQAIREFFIEHFYPEHVGFCKNCKVRTHYKHDERRFTYYCSKECSEKDVSGFKGQQVKKAYLKLYGMTPHEFLNQEHIRKKRNKKLGSAKTKKKRAETNLERFGVDNTGKSKTLRAKAKRTSLERYGETHFMKTTEGFQRWLDSAFRCEDYLTADGRTLKLQGYEGFVADLLEQNDWYVRSPKRGIKYTFENKKHIYHPDLVLKKEGKFFLAEVKSTYTLFDPKSVKRNLAKFRAASEQVDFVLFVPKPTEDVIISIRNPGDFSVRQLTNIVEHGKMLRGVRRIKCHM